MSGTAAEALRETTEALLAQPLNDRFAGAVPYLRAFARVLGGHAHLTAALADPARAAAGPGHDPPPAAGTSVACSPQAREGAAGLYALTPEDLAA